jgi:hypothetical protein
VGFFRFDLVATLFGGVDSVLSRIIYALIGISGLWALTLYGRIEEPHHHHGHHTSGTDL